MYSNKAYFPLVRRILTGLFSLFAFLSFAQCPATQSAAYAMEPVGLPNIDPLKAVDFFVNPADAAFYDNLAVSQEYFACRDLGVQLIEITGTDSVGQDFSCQEYLWVYDSVVLCRDEYAPVRVVAGRILTENEVTIPDLTIGLIGKNYNYFRSADQYGRFMFDDIERDEYQLVPTPTFQEARRGISTIDIILLQKHILNIKKLGSPYKIIAADLNSSRTITAYDMVILRKLILSIIDEFPDTPTWQFVPSDYHFLNPEDPFGEVFPTSIFVGSINKPSLDAKMVAIKSGDFNDSYGLMEQPVAESRAAGFTLQSKTREDSPSKIKITSLYPSQKETITGMQLALTIPDGWELSSVASELPVSEDNYHVKNGKLLFSWSNVKGEVLEAEQPVLELHWQPASHNSNLPPLTFGDDLSAEIYLKNDQIIPLRLEHVGAVSLEIGQPFPNPATDWILIPFYLEQPGDAALTIVNALGQQVFLRKDFFRKGQQQFRLSVSDFQNGIHFYTVSNRQTFRTGQFLVKR